MVEPDYYKMAKEKPNEYYELIKSDIEYYDSSVRRDVWVTGGYTQPWKICVLNPELNKENRIHAMRRAWYSIQYSMINDGLIDIDIFNESAFSTKEHMTAFNCTDYYYSHIVRTFGMDKSWEMVQSYPKVKEWFQSLCIRDKECPIEVLKQFYTKLKDVK